LTRAPTGAGGFAQGGGPGPPRAEIRLNHPVGALTSWRHLASVKAWPSAGCAPLLRSRCSSEQRGVPWHRCGPRRRRRYPGGPRRKRRHPHRHPDSHRPPAASRGASAGSSRCRSLPGSPGKHRGVTSPWCRRDSPEDSNAARAAARARSRASAAGPVVPAPGCRRACNRSSRSSAKAAAPRDRSECCVTPASRASPFFRPDYGRHQPTLTASWGDVNMHQSETVRDLP